MQHALVVVHGSSHATSKQRVDRSCTRSEARSGVIRKFRRELQRAAELLVENIIPVTADSALRHETGHVQVCAAVIKAPARQIEQVTLIDLLDTVGERDGGIIRARVLGLEARGE